MMCNWVWFLVLSSMVMLGESLPTNIMEDFKKPDQAMRPKTKRAQEMLMFGNQQNRQSEGTSSNSYASTAEKRTINSSGLGGLKAALADNDKPNLSKATANTMYDRDSFTPYDKSYDYAKVVVNELGDEMPQVWNLPPYSRYYMGEDRRKRSEKSTATIGSTTARPSTTPAQIPPATHQSIQAQVKRSVPIYQEPRFKREVDIEPEDVYALLSLWENERRNRNWRKYITDDYENEVDDNALLDEEDARNVLPWMDGQVYPQRHYSVDSLSPADFGIVRTHPPSYYDQFGTQYESSSQYGTPQYGLVYPQRNYYNTPEKRFMVARKRSQQAYDRYSNGAQLQLSPQSRGYPYQHRVVY